MTTTVKAEPNMFRVERSATIQAPARMVFRLIDDLHAWEIWSPYEERDPAMRRSYGGAESGRGAVYAWDGKGRAGAGRMEITASSEPSRVVIQLEVLRPFRARHTAEFTVEAEGEAAKVTWAMCGAAPLMETLKGIASDMIKGVGRDFEAGLGNLKRAAESAPAMNRAAVG